MIYGLILLFYFKFICCVFQEIQHCIFLSNSGVDPNFSWRNLSFSKIGSIIKQLGKLVFEFIPIIISMIKRMFLKQNTDLLNQNNTINHTQLPPFPPRQETTTLWIMSILFGLVGFYLAGYMGWHIFTQLYFHAIIFDFWITQIPVEGLYFISWLYCAKTFRNANTNLHMKQYTLRNQLDTISSQWVSIPPEESEESVFFSTALDKQKFQSLICRVNFTFPEMIIIAVANSAINFVFGFLIFNVFTIPWFSINFILKLGWLFLMNCLEYRGFLFENVMTSFFVWYFLEIEGVDFTTMWLIHCAWRISLIWFQIFSTK